MEVGLSVQTAAPERKAHGAVGKEYFSREEPRFTYITSSFMLQENLWLPFIYAVTTETSKCFLRAMLDSSAVSLENLETLIMLLHCETRVCTDVYSRVISGIDS